MLIKPVLCLHLVAKSLITISFPHAVLGFRPQSLIDLIPTDKL